MGLSRFRCLVVLLAVCFLVGADDPPKSQKDPQSSFEPRSKPGTGQKFLEKFVGEWDVAKTFHPRSGDPVRVTGTCRQTMVHDGRFLNSEFVFDQKGTKTTGLGIVGFESETGRFTSVWTDARSTRMSFRQSKDPFNGEEIVLFGRSLGTDNKNASTSRTTTRLEDDSRKIVHRQHTIDAEGKERLVMELVMTRKAVNAQKER